MLEIIENFTSSKNIYIEKLDIQGFTAFKTKSMNLVDLIMFLKESTDLRFTTLIDLFCADFPKRDKRFEIVYSLLSLKTNHRILIKVDVVEGETIPSITEIFKAAAWYEREAYDMFGVVFENNTDLRRILTDYGFVGHPLRKDFPVTGHLEVMYDETLKTVVYQPVKLDQEFREFDFLSSWNGPEYILPGDEKAKKSDC